MHLPVTSSNIIELSPKGYILATLIGNGDAAGAQGSKVDAEAIFRANPGKRFDALVNLADAESATSGALKVFGEMMSLPSVRRVALVGGSALTKTFAKMAMEFADHDRIRFFESVEQAEEWFAEPEAV